MTWYAVTAGTRVGVFRDWDQCTENTLGVSKSKYKGFRNHAMAHAYYNRALTNGTVRIIARDPPDVDEQRIPFIPQQGPYQAPPAENGNGAAFYPVVPGHFFTHAPDPLQLLPANDHNSAISHQGQPTPPPSPRRIRTATASTVPCTPRTFARDNRDAGSGQSTPTSSPETAITQHNSPGGSPVTPSRPPISSPLFLEGHGRPQISVTCIAAATYSASTGLSERALATPDMSVAQNSKVDQSNVISRPSQSSPVRRSATQPAPLVNSHTRNTVLRMPGSAGPMRGEGEGRLSPSLGVRRAATEPTMPSSSNSPETARQLDELRRFVADAGAACSLPSRTSTNRSSFIGLLSGTSSQLSPITSRDRNLLLPSPTRTSVGERGAQAGTGRSREVHRTLVDPFLLSPLIFSPPPIITENGPLPPHIRAGKSSGSAFQVTISSSPSSSREVAAVPASQTTSTSHSTHSFFPRKQRRGRASGAREYSQECSEDTSPPEVIEYPSDFPASLRSPMRSPVAAPVPIQSSHAHLDLPRSVTTGRGRSAGHRPVKPSIGELQKKLHNAESPPREPRNRTAKGALGLVGVVDVAEPDATSYKAAQTNRPTAHVGRRLSSHSTSSDDSFYTATDSSVASPAMVATDIAEDVANGCKKPAEEAEETEEEIVEVTSDEDYVPRVILRVNPIIKINARASGKRTAKYNTLPRTHSEPMEVFVTREDSSAPTGSSQLVISSPPSPSTPSRDRTPDPHSSGSSPGKITIAPATSGRMTSLSSCAESIQGSPIPCTAEPSNQYTCAVNFDPAYCHATCAHPDVPFCRHCRRPVAPSATTHPSKDTKGARSPDRGSAGSISRNVSQDIRVGSDDVIVGNALGMYQPAHVTNVVYPSELDPRSPVQHSTSVPSFPATVIFHRPSPLGGTQSTPLGS